MGAVVTSTSPTRRVRWRLVGTAALAYVGVAGSLATLYTALHQKWLGSVAGTAWAILALVLGLVVVILATDLLTERSAPTDDAEATPPPSLHQAIVQALRIEFERANYSDVIRIGEALGRPLFEMGAFSVRLEIGRMVEEAAARSSRRREQYVALIDTIGWSLVELGRYQEGERQIKHGLRLLEQLDDPFYQAKAHRHLGVIARRENRFADAEVEYGEAKNWSSKISNDRDALAMTAGLEYALGSLAFYRGDFESAASEISAAIASFELLADEYRLNMALVMRGDIEFRRDAMDEAIDTYRLVMQNADRNRETLQYVRACLGLAAVRAAEHEWDHVEAALRLLDGLDLREYKAEQDRLAELTGMLPRPH
jgi:tetratricopeptide (TPR) repeat protein